MAAQRRHDRRRRARTRPSTGRRDGDSDILCHSDGGDVLTWELENESLAAHLPDAPHTWQIAGTGDFDGDGDDDILWRHEEGAVTIWEMEDNAYAVNHNLGVVPTTWQIAGTGDLDSDGDDDALSRAPLLRRSWRNLRIQSATRSTYFLSIFLPTHCRAP